MDRLKIEKYAIDLYETAGMLTNDVAVLLRKYGVGQQEMRDLLLCSVSFNRIITEMIFQILTAYGNNACNCGGDGGNDRKDC